MKLLKRILFIIALLNSQWVLAEEERPQINLMKEVFENHKNYSLSLAVEKSGSDLYLIIEMDHNPARQAFVLDFADLGRDVLLYNAVRENREFGIQNKLAVNLPLIEALDPRFHSEVTLIKDSQSFRSYQRINLSQTLRALAKKGWIVDSNHNSFEVSQVEKVNLLFTESASLESTLRFQTTGFDLQKLAEGEVVQIFGEKPVSDIAEKDLYRIGDRVKVLPGQKVPYARPGQQWVEIPEQKFRTMELIGELKVGDRYLVHGSQPQKYMPKLTNENWRWQLVGENQRGSEYVIEELPPKLSESLMGRYVLSIVQNLEGQWSGLNQIKNLAHFLSDSPLEVRSDRVLSTATLLSTAMPSEMMDILLKEQDAFRKGAQLGSPQRMKCFQIF